MLKSKVKKFELELEAVPNPDFAASDHLGSVKIKSHRVEVHSLEEAREKANKFIDENHLGGGNWTGGAIYANGKQIAHVAYNGKIWEGKAQDWGDKTTEIKLAEGGTIGKNEYAAFYRGKHMEVHADTSYEAQKKAAELFKARYPGDVTVMVETIGGEAVVHDPGELDYMQKGGRTGYGFAVVFTDKGKHYIVEVDTTSQAELVNDIIWLYHKGEATKEQLDMTIDSFGDRIEIKQHTPVGSKIKSDFYKKQIPVLYNVNLDEKLPESHAEGGQLDADKALNETLAKYGWTSGKTEKGIEMVNRKGKRVALIVFDKDRYTFFDNANRKILSGHGELAKSAEKVAKDYFYASELPEPVMEKGGVVIKEKRLLNTDYTYWFKDGVLYTTYSSNFNPEDKTVKDIHRVIILDKDNPYISEGIPERQEFIKTMQELFKGDVPPEEIEKAVNSPRQLKAGGDLGEWIGGGAMLNMKEHGLERGSGKAQLKEIIAFSKKYPNNLYQITDDNSENIGFYWLKNGKFAKAETIGNPIYDFQYPVALRGNNHVIYKFRRINKEDFYAAGGSLAQYQYEQLEDLFNKGDQFRVHGWIMLKGVDEGDYEVVDTVSDVTRFVKLLTTGKKSRQEPFVFLKIKLLGPLNNYLRGDNNGIELLKSKYIEPLKRSEEYKNGGPVDLFFAMLGNGVTVADRSREEYGDFKHIAHISEDGNTITYYDKKLAPEVVKQIEQAAEEHKKKMAKWGSTSHYINVGQHIESGLFDPKTHSVRKELLDSYLHEYRKGGPMCPVGTEIETLLFSKNKFTVESAKEWVAENAKDSLTWVTPDVTDNFIRVRQKPVEHFRKGTFRTITLTDGVKAVIGCPMKAHRSYKKGGQLMGGVYLSKDGLTKFSVIPAMTPERQRETEERLGPGHGGNYWRIVLERPDHNGGEMDEAHDDWFDNLEDANMEAMRLANMGEKGGIKFEHGGEMRMPESLGIGEFSLIELGKNKPVGTELSNKLPEIKEAGGSVKGPQPENLGYLIWNGKQYPMRKLIVNDNGEHLEVVIAGRELHKALKKSKLVGKAGEMNREVYCYIPDESVKKLTNEELILELIAGGHNVRLAEYKEGGKVKKFKREKKAYPRPPHFAEPSSFDIRIGKTLATALLRKGDDILSKGVSVMCKEMGNGTTWREIVKEDLVSGQIPTKYKTFELWIDGNITAADLRTELEKFIQKNKIL